MTEAPESDVSGRLDGEYFEYAYDNADRLIHLSENGPSVTLASIDYDGQGRRDWMSRDAGAITDYEYDPISRLEVLTHNRSAAKSLRAIPIASESARATIESFIWSMTGKR